MRFMFAALAVALAMSSTGCQSMKSKGCGDSCAPCRPTCFGPAARPAAGCCDTGCCDTGCCDTGCCDSGCCGAGCCDCACNGCDSCQDGGCKLSQMAASNGPSMCPLGPGDSVYDFNPGPPSGQTAYPYYTTRGPRDFLMANPPSIGPTGGYKCR